MQNLGRRCPPEGHASPGSSWSKRGGRVRVSERRIAEWWEAPGIDGREAFDEEILYLNTLIDDIALPRWAILVRDRMPRWGFEPCAHRFLEGLEQVMGMVGSGRVCPRFGGCGDVPLSVQRQIEHVGAALLQWAGSDNGAGPFVRQLGEHTPERIEAAQAVGEIVLGIGQGPALVDATLDRWAERARSPSARRLVDGEEAPLAVLAQHPCSYALLWNINRLVRSIGNGETPSVLVCIPSLRVAPKLDPGRVDTLRSIGGILAQWLQGLPPQHCLGERIYGMIGPRDEVRRWLVASLYKALKLWLVCLDGILGETHDYFSLI